MHDDFRQASATCIRLYQNREYQTDRVAKAAKGLERILESIWWELCKLYSKKYDSWHADEKYKGCLYKKIGGKQVNVPYHIVDDFPSDKTFNHCLFSAASNFRCD